jgi:TIR domain
VEQSILMSDFLYDVYISYSSSNTDFVTHLEDALKSSGLTLFSFREVLVGDDLRVEKNKALISSRFVLVVLSEGYRNSPAAPLEWQAALQREQEESRVVVLPLLLNECRIPDELSRKALADFRGWKELEIFEARVFAAPRRHLGVFHRTATDCSERPPDGRRSSASDFRRIGSAYGSSQTMDRQPEFRR